MDPDPESDPDHKKSEVTAGGQIKAGFKNFSECNILLNF